MPDISNRRFLKPWVRIFAFVLAFLSGGLPISAGAGLLISQVQITGGAGKANDDFIEIFNSGSAPVDLSGYRLVKRTKTGDADTLIKSWTASAFVPAGGYYLWANSDFNAITVAPDATTTATLAADNGVALRLGASDSGTIVDSVAWGAAENAFIEGMVFPQNPGAGQAIIRQGGQDTANNAVDFVVSASNPRAAGVAALPPSDASQTGASTTATTSTTTTTNPPVTAPASDGAMQYDARHLLISEIAANPPGRDSGGEWVELENLAPIPLDISGWYLDDSGESLGNDAFHLPAGTQVPPGAWLQIVIPTGAFSLNNTGGDCVRLFSPDRAIQKSVCYSGSVKEGYTYARTPQGEYVWVDFPTPARPWQSAGSVRRNPEQIRVRISELLPRPAEDDEEYIELFNLGPEEVDLAGWKVSDLKRTYVIAAEDFSDTTLPPGEYFVIPGLISRITLNNSGPETVRLSDSSGNEIDEAEYLGSAAEGAVWARTASGGFTWSAAQSPGKENIIEDSAEPAKKHFDLDSDDSISGEVAGEAVILSTPASARLLPVGTQVKITASVSAASGILGKQIAYFSGSGMRLSLPAGVLLALGDRATVIGTIGESRGERYLSVVSVESVEPGEPPLAKRINTGLVGEEHEGWLVGIAGRIASTDGRQFAVDDGTGAVQVSVLETTGIQLPRKRTGDKISVVGIVSEYDGRYRILPRIQSDIVLAGLALPATGTAIAAISGLAGFLTVWSQALWLIFLRRRILSKHRSGVYCKCRERSGTVGPRASPWLDN